MGTARTAAAAGVAVVAVLSTLLAGCTAEGEPETQRPGPPPLPSATPTPPPGPRPPAPSGRPVAPDQPRAPDGRDRVRLVLVTHATVPALDLDTGETRRLAAGRVDDWAELGRPALPLRLVRGVAAVEEDPAAVGLVPLRAVGPSVNVARVDGVDPVEIDPRAVTVTLTGDVMLVRGVPNPRDALAPFTRRLREADITVGNLESTLSRDGFPTRGVDSLGASPALLGPLQRAGYDALSLANDHAGDFGPRALRRSVAAMAQSRIAPFGAGADVRRAQRPAILEARGVRFGFVGFNAVGETPAAGDRTPGALAVRMPPRTGPLSDADLARVEGVVRRAERRADVVIVLPHWGTRFTHRPEPVQSAVAERLAAAGADLVVGAHPHWVQGIERYGDTPVVHSLGNFVSDLDLMPETLEGVVAETVWWGEELKQLRLVPYRIGVDDFAPRPLAPTGSRGSAVLRDVWGSSRGAWARESGPGTPTG